MLNPYDTTFTSSNDPSLALAFMCIVPQMEHSCCASGTQAEPPGQMVRADGCFHGDAAC
jgi:hypothetical protein